MKLLGGVKASAYFGEGGPDSPYRYALYREWCPNGRGGHVLWIMLNPSTATSEVDDPTIRRCQVFARDWGYDGITVANLFALRATDPKALLDHPDPVGPVNDVILASLMRSAWTRKIVVAWGAHRMVHNRARKVFEMAQDQGRDLVCLGTTQNGQPRHPLYVRGDTKTERWVPPGP